MEHLVEAFIKKSGATYSSEIETQELSKQFGITLPEAFEPNKRWDFAVKTPGHVYTIETNFYTDKGSKLNTIASSYRLIAQESHSIPGFTFIWITDGKGWRYAKNSLHETFLVLDTLFNIKDMENGVLSQIFRA